MERRECLRLGWGLLALGVAGYGAARPHDRDASLAWRERALVGFGTTLWLKAAHEDAGRLESALEAAVREVRRVEQLMSLFDPDSALSRLNARGTLASPDPQLAGVLALASEVSRRSNGAFDASMQPYWTLWSQAAAQGELPSPRLLQRARRRVSWQAVHASPAGIRLDLPGMALSLNGIAQGWAADRVRAVLMRHGVRHALVDCGETSLLGKSPAGSDWSFAIEDTVAPAGASPLRLPRIVADGRAVATSSDAHTAFSADHRHHHILDPRTGYSPPHWSSVTVLAQSCALADALTKVFFMLPPSKVAAAARAWQADVVLEDKAGRWLATPGAGFTMPAVAPG